MTIKGSAFLWHQVRCMVAILFLIGQGLESPFVSILFSQASFCFGKSELHNISSNLGQKFSWFHELAVFTSLYPHTCMISLQDLVQDRLWITYTSLQTLLLSDAYSRLILFGLFTFDGFYIMPQVVDSLLDIVKTPRKPQYTMAPELPLILRSCLFDKVSFMCSSGMSLRNFACGDTFREHFQP